MSDETVAGSSVEDGEPLVTDDHVSGEDPQATQDALAAPEALDVPAAPEVVWRILTVASVALELPEQYPLVTLDDAEVAGRRLTFRVALPEGVALRHAMDGTNGPRPSTQDLLVATIRALGAQVAAVRLTGRIGAMYLAEMELVSFDGRKILECRPSDAVAVALRRGIDAPVLADERLFGPGDVT